VCTGSKSYCQLTRLVVTLHASCPVPALPTMLRISSPQAEGGTNILQLQDQPAGSVCKVSCRCQCLASTLKLLMNFQFVLCLQQVQRVP
jgi:hypothetical protein